MTPEFEWDADKEAANLQKHEVSFTQAAAAFMDPFAVDWSMSGKITTRSESFCLV
jgi:uncharacterized DUF497 family protein